MSSSAYYGYFRPPGFGLCLVSSWLPAIGTELVGSALNKFLQGHLVPLFAQALSLLIWSFGAPLVTFCLWPSLMFVTGGHFVHIPEIAFSGHFVLPPIYSTVF